MRKKLKWRDKAKAELRAINRSDAMQVLCGIDRFSATGEGDIKLLIDTDPPESRLRIGDYRVRFRDLPHTMTILSIQTPKQGTPKLNSL